MAEVIYRRLEAMLPQLVELQSSGIFSHDEIRSIVKHRREHEYHLVQRRHTRKEDFLQAIKYEVKLHLLEKKRKKRLRITGTGHHTIQNRINHLYSRAVKKFKGDLNLWLQYIEFAQQNKRKISLGQIFGKALALHPSCTNLWMMAAKFHFEDLNDASSARSLLQQGLRVNSSSQNLWIECFRIEMMFADKLRKRREILDLGDDVVIHDSTDEVLSYKLASVVFNQATKAIPGSISFRLDFLPVCRPFDDSLSIQNEIYDSVKKDFPVHPLTWDALARRPWLQTDLESLSEAEVLDLEEKSADLFAEGIAYTEESLSAVDRSIETNQEIWTCYLKWCIERLKDERSTEELKEKVQNRIKVDFRQASKDGLLPVAAYLQYVEVLDSMDAMKEADEVLVAGVKAHSSSLELWMLQLGRCKCQTSARKGINSVLTDLEKLFKEAFQNVPAKDSLPLWELWLAKVSSVSSSYDDIEKIYKTGLANASPEVKEAFQCHYLDWSMRVGGISRARTVYTEIVSNPPVSYQVYQKCLDLEKNAGEANIDLSKLRDLFEMAVREHGSDHYDLWLSYIAMELSQESGDMEKVGRLCWRATKQLQPQYVSSFIEVYTALQTHSRPILC